MAKRKITPALVERAATKEGNLRQVFYWDTEIRGFGLCVSATSKSFIFRRRGRQVTLGRYPDIDAKEARTAAGQAAARWKEEMRRPRKRDRVTLRQARERHARRMRNRGRSERSVESLHFLTDRYLSDWMDRPLESVTRKELRERHERVGERSGRPAANLAMRWFRACWNTAMRDDEHLPVCPTIAIDWFREDPREEVVEDVRAWWLAVQRVGNPVKRTLHTFVLTTGLRSEDARTVRWNDIDLEAGTLHRPCPKGGRDRAFTIPLSDFTLRLLLAWQPTVEMVYPRSPWVFPSRDRRGRLTYVKSLVGDRRGLPGPHVLRHTYATALDATGASFGVVRALLNHSPRSGGITMRYVHADVDQMRAAQEAVTRYLLGRVKKRKDEAGRENVLPFRRKAG